MLLALLGGAAGVILAKWLIPVLAALNPIRGIAFAAFLHNFEMDQRVLVFAFFVTLLTGLIFGLLPALKACGAHELMSRIKEADQRSGAAVSGRRWLNGLIVAEIAIAQTLLVCGGLMMQSFQRLQHVDLGFTPDNLLTFKMVLPESKYSQYPQRIAFTDQLLESQRIFRLSVKLHTMRFSMLKGGHHRIRTKFRSHLIGSSRRIICRPSGPSLLKED